jgi:hypothetical protein
VGAVFSDFTLSKEVPLGMKKTLKPPTSGQLVLRCVDTWTELADNNGEITVTIRRAPRRHADKSRQGVACPMR